MMQNVPNEYILILILYEIPGPDIKLQIGALLTRFLDLSSPNYCLSFGHFHILAFNL